MKLNKLTEQLKTFFSLSEETQLEQQQELKEILKKLREKEKSIIAKQDIEEDEQKKQKYTNELTIIHLQRKKALSLLKNGLER